MKLHNWRSAVLAVIVGTFALAGEASAAPVTWDYGGGPIFTTIGTGSQPSTFSSGGFDTRASGFTFVPGGGGSLALTARTLGRGALTGLGVCNSLLESSLGCFQIDRIGLNDFLRIELPGSNWEALSAVVGFVTPISTPLDAFVLYGSNTASPTNTTDLSLLLSGNISALGSNLGLGFWNIPINAPSGYDYLFFTTAASNDGYSLRSLTAGSVPEPGTLALTGIGILGMGALRRRKAKA
jgi:hypothetical protein